ncbi:hypothetical protein EJ05DRAFT_473935 [Pseudovirgaria hyperparasitica]|uniref:Acid phosphatase-like protein n=1 Tax=Pseudovirgaria hyperparasitica TaxID=470096 RepID=A0A6A6WF37_9PEZI|nr:uncharacterized protein EJ05DRAFT_473935 [Pseudovirgaria hyperparasitica]KAF2761438.1 hypothetical protein EJ05DRAFT_473935 [Pseudovirgaria hyperparasitica]
MNGGLIFLILLLLVIILSYVGWLVFSRRRASKLGLPPPSANPIAAFRARGSGGIGNIPTPRTGGLVGWFNDKFRAMKNKRYASGAYESSGTQARGSARAPLDPDEAWDSRVGNEAYYEEQELGLHQPTAYGGGGYNASVPAPYEEDFNGRGRSRTRELDERYDEEMGRGAQSNPFGDHAATAPAGGANPFGEGAERSDIGMRGVSPRPIETGGHQPTQSKSSPTERRSLFREDV